MILFHYYENPLGLIEMASDGERLVRLLFTERRDHQETRLSLFEKADSWLDSYFRRHPVSVDFSISIDSESFAGSVYEACMKIPFGQTATYGQIASEVARRRKKEKMSAQAVGQALKRNELMLIVPCHRVIGADGSPTGFAGGIQLKKRLLIHESAKESI